MQSEGCSTSKQNNAITNGKHLSLKHFHVFYITITQTLRITMKIRETHGLYGQHNYDILLSSCCCVHKQVALSNAVTVWWFGRKVCGACAPLTWWKILNELEKVMWLFGFRNGAHHPSRLPLFIVRLYRENSGAVWSVKITQLAAEKYAAAGHVKRATNSISSSRNSSLTRNSCPVPSLGPNNRCLQLMTKWPRIRKYINRNTTEPCTGPIVLTRLPMWVFYNLSACIFYL